MTRSFFIAGTDTDVGKTFCSSLLLRSAVQAGLTCLPYKPVAAGCEMSPSQDKQPPSLQNDDALSLMAACHCQLPYQWVNPYAFEPPIAPHIAAKQVDQVIQPQVIQQGYLRLQAELPDLLLVEGAGGWQLPLNLPTQQNPNTVYLADWVAEQAIPVILVVGMKLGCLNHTLLTVAAIKAAGVPMAGWVANQISPDMMVYQQNLRSLEQLIDAPLLAEVPFGTDKPSVFSTALTMLFGG